LLFPHHPLYSWTEIEKFGQLDTVRHSAEVGLGLLPVVMATLIAPAATADDIALVALMSVGIVLVAVLADLRLGEHLPSSLQL